MKIKLGVALFFLCLTAVRPAAPLTESSFTQVVNDVKVLSRADQSVKPARVADLFRTPDLLQTGRDSLAELTAQDRTVTRVGANTVFSFDANGRNLRLEKGSVLFHSPAGKGGGTIRTGGASASVLGTTLMVSTTEDGGFKAIVLEGKGQIRLPNGDFRILRAGQLVFVLPNAQSFGPLLNINLEKLVRGSRLVGGFTAKLPSLEKVEREVDRQNQRIRAGRAEDTHQLVGRRAGRDEVEVVGDDILERVFTQSPLLTALRTDLAVTTSQIDPRHVFLQSFALVVGGLGESQFRGAVARNLTINTPLVDLTGLSDGFPGLDLLATSKLEIQSSVTFIGDAVDPHLFRLIGGGGITVADHAVVEVKNLGDWQIQSPAALNFRLATLRNDDGGFQLLTGSDLRLESTLVDSRFIEIDAADIDLDLADLRLAQGLGVGVGPHHFNVAARNRLTAVETTFIGLGPSLLVMKAAETLEWQNVSVLGFGFINLAARTLVLENVNFPGGTLVSLRSENGLLAPNPNTGQSIQPGFVNYLNNVRYGGTLLDATPHPNITLTPLP